MEGNSSVYQVYPGSRINGEGRAEVLRAWGPGFKQEGAGTRGGGGTGGATQSVRGNYKSFKGIHLTVLERMHQFIMGGGGGAGRAGQLDLRVETIHPLRG